MIAYRRMGASCAPPDKCGQLGHGATLLVPRDAPRNVVGRVPICSVQKASPRARSAIAHATAGAKQFAVGSRKPHVFGRRCADVWPPSRQHAFATCAKTPHSVRDGRHPPRRPRGAARWQHARTQATRNGRSQNRMFTKHTAAGCLRGTIPRSLAQATPNSTTRLRGLRNDPT
jgi:hypothetical protein